MRSLRRLRAGELIALAGAACVIASLILPWYGSADGTQLSAWDTFGAGVAFLILGCLCGLLLALANVFERTPALPVAAAVWGTLLGFGALIAAVVRLLDAPAGHGTLLAGAWLALAGGLALLIGSWQSMRDERTELYRPLEAQRRRLT